MRVGENALMVKLMGSSRIHSFDDLMQSCNVGSLPIYEWYVFSFSKRIKVFSELAPSSAKVQVTMMMTSPCPSPSPSNNDDDKIHNGPFN